MARRGTDEVSETGEEQDLLDALAAETDDQEGDQEGAEVETDSETEPQEQERESSGGVDTISEVEKVRRELQSKHDKTLHDLRMQMESQVQERAATLAWEQQRTNARATMDDEDYGRFIKAHEDKIAEAQSAQATQTSSVNEVNRQVAITLQGLGYDSMPNQAYKDKLGELERTTIHSVADFQKAVVKLLTEYELEQRKTKSSRTSSEAQVRDDMARAAELAAPTTSTGRPLTAATRRHVTEDEWLIAGVAEERQKAARKRG